MTIDIARALRETMEKYSLSPPQLSQASGVNRSTITEFIREDTTNNIRSDNLERLIGALPYEQRLFFCQQAFAYNPGPLAEFLHKWQRDHRMSDLEVELLIQVNTCGRLSKEIFRRIRAGLTPSDEELALLSVVFITEDGPYSEEFWQGLRDDARLFKAQLSPTFGVD